MDRIRQRYTGTYDLTATAYDEDGTEATITGTPTVTITDSAGTEVVAETAATLSGGTMTYAASVDDLPDLDTYEAIWTGTVAGTAQEWHTRFELVGGYHFELHELRSHNGSTFASTTDYPAATIEAARTWVEKRIEHATNVAMVPRGNRETLYGDGSQYLRVAKPRVTAIRSIIEDGTAWTAAEIAEVQIRATGLYLENDVWYGDSVYVVLYEHGHEDCPEPVKEAGLILAGEYLLQNNLRSRATAESTDVGFYRLSIAGAGGRTGIPEVDAIIADYRENTAWVG
jgi:hypothetical protein